MRKQLGDRLPEWTSEEVALVKGSNDFYGMNHYCANYIRHKDGEADLEDFSGNVDILFQNKDGAWIGPETQSPWLRPNALGFRKLIKWLSVRYGGPTFYVTENGTSLKGETQLPLKELLDDEFRCQYFRDYIGALADAHTKDGVDVRGYSAWSLMEYVPLVSCLFSPCSRLFTHLYSYLLSTHFTPHHMAFIQQKALFPFSPFFTPHITPPLFLKLRHVCRTKQPLLTHKHFIITR
jgi:beta-glucosidase/6-phospho-beta-glucosidase/beta-galactosidase